MAQRTLPARAGLWPWVVLHRSWASAWEQVRSVMVVAVVVARPILAAVVPTPARVRQALRRRSREPVVSALPSLDLASPYDHRAER